MSWQNSVGGGTSGAQPGTKLFGWEISRRHFMVLVGGGGAVVVAGSYGIVASESSPANNGFWTLRVVRAGRGARLTAEGLPAFRAAPGPAVFPGKASPAVLIRPAGPVSDHSHSQTGSQTEGHSSDGTNSAVSYPQPENRTWGDVVVLEVEVANTSAVPMLFSPGQLRLKLADGLTITPEDASRRPEAIAAGATEMLWVSYLAPSDATGFSVEFTDPMHNSRMALGIPELLSTKGQS